MRDKQWVYGRVNDLIDSLESGVSVNGDDDIPSSEEPAVLKVSAVTYGYFDQQASKPIRNAKELKRAKCNPRAGEIIISRSNTPELVGASAYIERDYPNRFLPDKLWQTVPKNDVVTDMRWLAFFLSCPRARFRLKSLATGTSNSMKNITKSELMTLPLSIPPFPEQRAIADLLSTWDNAIEKTERLIQVKERRFRWLLRELISDHSSANKERSDWKKVRIGSFLTESRIPDTENDPRKRLRVRLHLKGVEVRECRGTESDGATSYFVRKAGQFIYGKQNVFRGAVGIVSQELDGYSSTQDLPAFDVADVVNKDWLLSLFSYPDFYKKLESYASGSGSKRLHPKELFNMKILLPALPEQQRIAETLKTAQRDVDLLKELAVAVKILVAFPEVLTSYCSARILPSPG